MFFKYIFILRLSVHNSTNVPFLSSGVLFCVGGRGGSGDPFRSIECYSIAKNSWFFGPEMNSRRRHVGVISVGGERDVANNNTTGSERRGKMSRRKSVEIEATPQNILKYAFLLAFF